jgi:hypothetical protein
MIEGCQAGQILKKFGQTFGPSKNNRVIDPKREDMQIRNQSLGHEAINLAVDLYSSGPSLMEVGKQLECDPSTVRLALIAAGEPGRGHPPTIQGAIIPAAKRSRLSSFVWVLVCPTADQTQRCSKGLKSRFPLTEPSPNPSPPKEIADIYMRVCLLE